MYTITTSVAVVMLQRRLIHRGRVEIRRKYRGKQTNIVFITSY